MDFLLLYCLYLERSFLKTPPKLTDYTQPNKANGTKSTLRVQSKETRKQNVSLAFSNSNQRCGLCFV